MTSTLRMLAGVCIGFGSTQLLTKGVTAVAMGSLFIAVFLLLLLTVFLGGSER